MEDLRVLLEGLEEGLEEKDVRMMSPLVLAYIGDAVYEIYIRNFLVRQGRASVNDLHRASTRYVKAKAQAEIVHVLEVELTEEEWTVVKRGRNQKSATTPKNAELIDYKYATGLEALIGYLFLCGKTERLVEIVKRAIDIVNKA